MNLPYRPLNAVVAQTKNCQFGDNTDFELKNETTTSDSGVWRGAF
jgi:hypothetical protein